MNSKMTGKQTVVQGFDLNQFVSGAEQPDTVSQNAKKPASETKKEGRGHVTAKETSKPSSGNSRHERDLLTERVQIKLSKSEMATLQERIGLVPMSAYLRKFLKDGGVI
jgi:hypothetical protein